MKSCGIRRFRQPRESDMSDYRVDTAAYESADVMEETTLLAQNAAAEEIGNPATAWPKDQMLDRLRTCD